jgi:hypothetical protein
MWVSSPSVVSEEAGRNDADPPVFNAAPLGCEPVYLDWGAVGPLHVYGDVVVPGATYKVQAVDLPCGIMDEEYYSPRLAITTSRWGDIVGRCDVIPCSPPDGLVNVATDVTAVVDKFMNRPSAPGKTRTDLAGAVPNSVVDIEDVVYVLDAFRGFDYPFEASEGCP